jgi:hypothetical protein
MCAAVWCVLQILLTSDTRTTEVLHRSEILLFMSVQGQNRRLPHRNSNGRFTSDNGHYVANLLALPTRPFGRYGAATLAPAKGLPAVPNMRPMVAGWTA